MRKFEIALTEEQYSSMLDRYGLSVLPIELLDNVGNVACYEIGFYSVPQRAVFAVNGDVTEQIMTPDGSWEDKEY